ncbi:MAG: MFS transporter [Acetobacteraceae bacterium]
MPDLALPATSSTTRMLLPFSLIVFLGYSAVGIPLSTLPLQVHDALGYGTTMVGIVIGLSAAATLLTRQIAGGLSDRRGPKYAVLAGLCTAALTGGAYLLSTVLPPGPGLAALLAGRLMLGLGDSLFTTGVMAWAVVRVGPHNAGRAMAWIGIAMYGALAVGAPVGASLDWFGGFGAVAAAVVVMPLLAIPVALALPGPAGVVHHRSSFLGVVRRIWAPGLALVLASSGFGTIAAFLSLRYAALGWSGAGLALTGFGVAYIVSRLLFAGLPDRLGGVHVALASLAIEAVGLALIATAGIPAMAFIGTAVTGLGYSMVFPALGVETVRRVPPESRGVALGAFLACFDLGLGAAGPVTGLVAGGYGLPAAFVAATAAAVLSMGLVWTTRVRR